MSGSSKRIKSLKPLRMWIDGNCYNIKHLNKNTEILRIPKDENQLDESHKSFNISKDSNGKQTTEFRMPVRYYQQLHTCPNFNIRSIQHRTNTEILIPKKGYPSSITITGENYENVALAREEIHVLLGEIRSKDRPLQFISIPTLSEEVQTNFKKFKEDLLDHSAEIKGLDESIFQKPEKLHLTIIVMSLLDDTESEEAIRALTTFKQEILDPLIKDKLPLTIRLQGIECMDNKVTNTNILYAKASFLNEDNECYLQNIVNSIAGYFYEKGLCKESTENVKIHVTLMNTKYRNDKHGPKKYRYKRLPFDATYIMDKYKEYDFGLTNFDSIHLSLISSVGLDGFYNPLFIIKL